VQKLLHIITTGTSIIRNTSNKCNENTQLTLHCTKLKKWSTSPPESQEDLEAGNNAHPGSPIFKAVLEAVAGDPKKISAELNALLTYAETRANEKTLEHKIILLSTDTGAGWFSTKIIEEFLKNMDTIPEQYIAKGHHHIAGIEAERIQLLGKDFAKGSINLLAKIKTAIAKHKQWADEILLNLTGGFKPETGLLIMSAGLLGANKAYYIHEYMSEIVEIPIIPITLAEPVKTALENARKGLLDHTTLEILRRHGILKPSEKEQAWLREIANILLKLKNPEKQKPSRKHQATQKLIFKIYM